MVNAWSGGAETTEKPNLEYAGGVHINTAWQCKDEFCPDIILLQKSKKSPSTIIEKSFTQKTAVACSSNAADKADTSIHILGNKKQIMNKIKILHIQESVSFCGVERRRLSLAKHLVGVNEKNNISRSSSAQQFLSTL